MSDTVPLIQVSELEFIEEGVHIANESIILYEGWPIEWRILAFICVALTAIIFILTRKTSSKAFKLFKLFPLLKARSEREKEQEEIWVAVREMRKEQAELKRIFEEWKSFVKPKFIIYDKLVGTQGSDREFAAEWMLDISTKQDAQHAELIKIFSSFMKEMPQNEKDNPNR